jgi:predicted NAD/FAD-dependent oxidoreductase
MVTLGQDVGFMTRMARKELAQARNDTGAQKIDPKDNFY